MQYGHGLFSSQSEVLDQSALADKNGWVMVAVDWLGLSDKVLSDLSSSMQPRFLPQRHRFHASSSPKHLIGPCRMQVQRPANDFISCF